MDTTRVLTDQQRADIATARNLLNTAAEGGSAVDYQTIAALLDRVLATACRHEPVFRDFGRDRHTGRPRITCYACGVIWYGDYPERLMHATGWPEEVVP